MADDTLYFDDIQEGMEIPPLEKEPITKMQLVKYAGASGDFNPLHYDDDFARMAGMQNGVIAHGMLSMGFAAQLMTGWLRGGTLKRLRVRFTAITEPGDTVTCSGKVTRKYTAEGENLIECEIETRTDKGSVTTKGTAVAALSSRG